MRRGEVYEARLDPTDDAEQAGSRPVVIVSRDAINASSPVIIVVPCTTYRPGRRLTRVKCCCMRLMGGSMWTP